jgi:hypothetical protein
MGDVLWLVGCFALKIVEDGFRVVAAMVWLKVDSGFGFDV